MNNDISKMTYNCNNVKYNGNRIMLQHLESVKDKATCAIPYNFTKYKQVKFICTICKNDTIC